MRLASLRELSVSCKRHHVTEAIDSRAPWLAAFVDSLRLRAAEAEELGKLPDATIADAWEADYFSTLTPRCYGGQERGFAEFLDVNRRIAQGCTSSAWTLSFLALHAWIACKFPRELQQELFAAGRPPLIPMPLAPTGKARQAEGGFQISGRWEWATGIQHGEWVMVSCLEPETPGPLFCMLRTADVEIEDNWRVSGMAATGSNAVRAREVFVPRHRAVAAIHLKLGKSPGEELHGLPTLAYPLGPTLALVAATPALGAAEAAVEHFTERIREKIQAYSFAKQAELPATHLRLGEALATVRAARLVWRDAIRELEEIGPRGNEAPVESLAAIRLAAADVVRMANVAANTLAAAAGASSSYLTAPLQRILRDVQMIRGHVVFDWDRAAQIGGKIHLGFPPEIADLL